jgi:hypothetical protein
MATNNRREKRKIARLQKTQEEQKEILDETMDVVEIEEKDMGIDTMTATPIPATSFEQLDALQAAQEQADAVREVTCDVQDLVYNILYDKTMNPDQKTEAMNKVASEFNARVKKVTQAEMADKDFDVELLELEAILAKEKRHLPVIEKISDFAQKTFSSSNEKYPSKTKSQVRSSLARAIENIKKGGEDASEARNFLPELKLASKILEIGISGKNSLIIEKDATETYRAIMFPSNNFIDWDGEIISEAAHKEYVDWVNKNMDLAPVSITWHKAGTARESQVDFVGYENGHLIMSAPLTEKEAAGLFRAQILTDIGMSHGSLVFERDPKNSKVITKYRMFEVSELPLDHAANPFTDFQVAVKEADMSTVNTQDFLAAILGSVDKAKQFIERTGLKQVELQKAGIPSKEAPADVASTEETKVEKSVINIDEIVARVAKELGMAELSEEFALLKEKAEKVEILEAVVRDLAKSREDELAQMISAPVSKNLSWMQARPSESSKTALKPDDKEDQKLSKSKPELGWLSKLTNTEPLQAS